MQRHAGMFQLQNVPFLALAWVLAVFIPFCRFSVAVLFFTIQKMVLVQLFNGQMTCMMVYLSQKKSVLAPENASFTFLYCPRCTEKRAPVKEQGVQVSWDVFLACV